MNQSVREWIDSAPSAVREELQSVPVMNFLRQHRNTLFQMIGRYDGAMSEECKERVRTADRAICELIESLEST